MSLCKCEFEGRRFEVLLYRALFDRARGLNGTVVYSMWGRTAFDESLTAVELQEILKLGKILGCIERTTPPDEVREGPDFFTFKSTCRAVATVARPHEAVGLGGEKFEDRKWVPIRFHSRGRGK